MASVLGLLFAVRIFSKSCITFAGEKKCVPMTLVGSFSTAAMSSMFKPLVFVQMRQSGFVFFSMSKKTCLRPSSATRSLELRARTV